MPTAAKPFPRYTLSIIFSFLLNRFESIPPGTSETGRGAASAAPTFFMERAIVYVDGFNLYYGAVKNTPYKWLDLSKLCRRLLPRYDVQHIHYFTATVQPRKRDPQQRVRQEIYLRALNTVPNLTITYGRFLTHKVVMPLAHPKPGRSPYATVLKTEEKGSDVNLASRLLRDGYRDNYDVAAIISNDSDLLLAIQIVRNELGKTVGLISPQKRPSHELKSDCDFMKKIWRRTLKVSQFPNTLNDTIGTISNPQSW